MKKEKEVSLTSFMEGFQKDEVTINPASRKSAEQNILSECKLLLL